DDIDGAGRQSALRHESQVSALGQLAHKASRLDILCQIEIGASPLRADISNQSVQIVWGGADDYLAVLSKTLQGICRPDINFLKAGFAQSLEMTRDSRIAKHDAVREFGNLQKSGD